MKQRARWVKNLAGVLIILIHIAPFYVLFTTALKRKGDYTSRWLFPAQWSLESFEIALSGGRLFQSMWNTLIVAGIATGLIVALGAMAAYPLARYRTRLSKFISMIILGVMMVPPLSVLVPIYSLMVSLGGMNTFGGIIVLSATYGLPTAVFMYTNFISTIPSALDEAALIDGCSKYAIFYRIIIPSLKPVTASVIILTGIGIWNDYSFQLYILQKPTLRTVTLMLKTFFADGNTNINAAAAAAIIAIVPLVILYLFLSQYFVQGVIDSSIK